MNDLKLMENSRSGKYKAFRTSERDGGEKIIKNKRAEQIEIDYKDLFSNLIPFSFSRVIRRISGLYGYLSLAIMKFITQTPVDKFKWNILRRVCVAVGDVKYDAVTRNGTEAHRYDKTAKK